MDPSVKSPCKPCLLLHCDKSRAYCATLCCAESQKHCAPLQLELAPLPSLLSQTQPLSFRSSGCNPQSRPMKPSAFAHPSKSRRQEVCPKTPVRHPSPTSRSMRWTRQPSKKSTENLIGRFREASPTVIRWPMIGHAWAAQQPQHGMPS